MSPDLEHLAVALRRDERKEELAGRLRDGARALGGRQAARPLVGILGMQAVEHAPNAVVEHPGT